MDKSICARGIGSWRVLRAKLADALTHIATSRSACPGGSAKPPKNILASGTLSLPATVPTAQRLMVSHADIQKNDFAQYISIIEAAESRL
jgi:hypothetical protein